MRTFNFGFTVEALRPHASRLRGSLVDLGGRRRGSDGSLLSISGLEADYFTRHLTSRKGRCIDRPVNKEDPRCRSPG